DQLSSQPGDVTASQRSSHDSLRGAMTTWRRAYAANGGLAGALSAERHAHAHRAGAEALEMAIWTRQRAGTDYLSGLIHHGDRGSQYMSIRYTERLAETGGVPSVGSRGDSYDNAMAESTIGQIKAELIHR